MRRLFPLLVLAAGCGEAPAPPPEADAETTTAAAVAATTVAAGDAPRTDWPQWQGPNRTAVSAEKGLLKTWPKAGPKLLWTATGLGEGFSTPSVTGGRVYTMGNKGKKEYVLALSADGGSPAWEYEVGPVRAGGGGYAGPRCTPTVDGDRLYALGLNGDLVCLKADDGTLVWRADLKKDFGGSVGAWDYSESPLVDGDKVVVTPGGGKNTLVALKKDTGEKVWGCPVAEGNQAHYASAIAADFKGRRMYVQFLSGGVVGVAAKDGQLLWRYDKPANGTANCSTPIYRDGVVFAASGYGTGGGAARLAAGAGGKITATEVYFTKHMKNHHGGMVLLGDYVYGSDEGLLTCLNFKTGKVAWAEREPGKGSIAAADGKLIYRNEGGPVYLVQVNPSKYVKLGKFEPKKSGKPAWPHPVVAGGKLYVRDQDELSCYDLKGG